MAKTTKEFDAAFAVRLLVSEGSRTRILALIFSTLAGISILGNLVYQSNGLVLAGLGWMTLTFLLAAGFEWMTLCYFSRLTATGRQPARWRLFANVLVETSLPTLTLVVMLSFSDPFTVLTSPVTYLYFLIIMLSALRLDARLCLFSGAVATLGFAALVLWQVPEFLTVIDAASLKLRMNLGMRCVLFMTAGISAALLSRFIRSSIQETMRGIEERQRIVSLFGQHVSPQVVNQLLSQSRGTLSGQHDVCVLILDIRKFTTFSENRAADEVVAYLNTLWAALVRIVNQHQGTVNKFLGDGFLALFGVPVDSENPCRQGVRAAQTMLIEVQRLVEAGTLPPTRLGLALHAGSAIAGLIGSDEKKEYTVIGDVVNVAFRIEALNKELGSQLLISAHVREHAGIMEGERLEPMPIRGRQESIELFRLA